MYCESCGYELDSNASFCKHCGAQIERGSDDTSMKRFVGKNYNYYRHQWSKTDQPEKALSWNWAAFFLGVFWLGYRGLYKTIIAILGLFLVVDLIDYGVGPNDFSGTLQYVSTIGIYAWIGLNGNRLYYQLAKSKASQLAERDERFDYNQGTKGIAIALGLFMGYLILHTMIVSAFV
ncbi:zinc-ribbon domain-containing protein [Pelagirhabdus alkalitolerans]|uniref:Zinc-ribbon domain-containing protein n=1 Tax=Pelagirhabdus alkalitolerans TaxID=1612202 RepID=A0A1G6GFV5_9BACI|nr:DUF2628 domain-containing protein [Pelagirhabdus alkalitolerans]SDB80867.1 zinc-ribbon domain-containing protein [Pelagirhabdus alkalitolerans]